VVPLVNTRVGMALHMRAIDVNGASIGSPHRCRRLTWGASSITEPWCCGRSSMNTARLGWYSSRIAFSAGPFGPVLVKTRASMPTVSELAGPAHRADHR